MSDEMREVVVRMKDRGYSTKEIVAITLTPRGTVNNIVLADKDARTGNYAHLIHMYLHVSKPLARWAAKRNGVDIDVLLAQAGLESV